MATVGTALGTVSTLLVMMILVVLSREARGGYTCSAVTTRLKTQVVCYFDLNVKEYAYSFKVQFYSRDDRKMANPENILRCDYTSHGKLQCQNATGDVTFDGVVSDQLTLTRPASPDKAGGQYVCRLEQPQPEMRFDPCVLTYLETPTTPATSTTPPTSTPATATVLANVIVPYILVVICVAVIVYMSRDRLKTWRRQLRIWWNQRVNRPQNPAGERDAEACLMVCMWNALWNFRESNI
ncbi:uncharacterized protein LOC143296603 [Babylonia areolata]|uniref:uncharacterized protein LOC143296603 n=1 Tax=Babylonia areolata TaxID=304850 RepID=UPI003FCFB171